ncbi:small basic family protein [bacterium 210917-DFI.7.65]|uniref:small basic family protein n=1 Tax=Ruthenibacterium lactatiformans TaxID=1550024 RepID=UPI001D277192|nr:small basic family protein [Clostridiales bacterium]MCB6898810.1 small basic family protein [bacterium 210917-DFI.7.65]
MYIVLSVLLGVLIGALLPWSIPAQYSIYAAVMLLAALDAAAGGINARLHHKFRGSLFVSGALGNGLIAVFLTYMGERIGISLYLAAVVVFGTRLFQNFGEIRRELLTLSGNRNTIGKNTDKTQELGQSDHLDPL